MTLPASVGVGELCGVLAALTWSVSALLFSRLGARMSGGAMSLGKTLSAAILLTSTHLALAAAQSAPLVPPALAERPGALLAISAIVGLTLGDTALFGAMTLIGAPRALLIHASAPVFATFGGMAFLAERPDTRSMVGVLVTVAGIAIVVSVRAGGREVSQRNARIGLVLGLIAAVGQAAGSLLSRRAMQGDVAPLAAASFRLLVGGGALFLVAVPTGHTRRWIAELSHQRQWLKVAGASFIGTYCGLWLAQTALQRASSAGVASTLLATTPVFLLPLAHVTGSERMTLRASVGVLVALLGVALLSLR
jgi:drug/metabolite transporter (DMT)-like permease